MKIRINVGFLCGIKKGTILETFSIQEDCYIVNINGEKCLINPSWCEIVKENKTETKTIKITKDLIYDSLLKNNVLTEKENYINFKPIKEDIELSNEFYFKHKEVLNVLFKTELINGRYIVANDKDKYKVVYSEKEAKEFINNGFWIVVEPPKVEEFNKDNIVKGRDQQKQEGNKNNDILEQMKKENDIKFASFNKKATKFIELTSMEGFKTSIARDKIVSLVQYEGYCFVTTVAIEGTFTVIESREDIIKMLEE